MQVKTRKEAMISGDNTYFTGSKCKNGHLSYRYVASGACRECLNFMQASKATSPNETPTAIARKQRLEQLAIITSDKEAEKLKRQEEAALRQQKMDKAARIFRERKNTVENQMVQVKIRCYPEDRRELAAVAYALAAMRDHRLQPEDIHPVTRPIGGHAAGTALFQLYCFSEDVDALRAASNACLSRHPIMPPQHTRQAAALINQLEKINEGDGSEPPLTFK